MLMLVVMGSGKTRWRQESWGDWQGTVKAAVSLRREESGEHSGACQVVVTPGDRWPNYGLEWYQSHVSR